MEGKQEKMKYSEPGNCEKPVLLTPLGLKGHRDCNPEYPVLELEGRLARTVTLNRQMAATASLKFEGVPGSKYPYFAFLLTFNLLAVHINQTQSEDTEQETLVGKALKGQLLELQIKVQGMESVSEEPIRDHLPKLAFPTPFKPSLSVLSCLLFSILCSLTQLFNSLPKYILYDKRREHVHFIFRSEDMTNSQIFLLNTLHLGLL